MRGKINELDKMNADLIVKNQQKQNKMIQLQKLI